MARLLIRRTPLQEALICIGLAVAGVLLAMADIWIGSGLLDGFHSRDVAALRWRYQNVLPFALLLATLGGVFLFVYYDAALARRHAGWVVLFGIARAFAMFMFLGFGLIFAFLLAPLGALVEFIVLRWRGKQPEADQASAAKTLIVALLWVMMLPFSLLGVESEGEIDIPLDSAPRGLAAVIPLALLLLLFGPGFESEATGDRVDVLWLTAFAGYCLADCAIVLGFVVPRLELRERAREVASRRRGG